MEERILEFDNKKYKIRVGMYDDETKSLKVELLNIDTGEVEELTAGGTALLIPPVPTPDCVILNDINKSLNDKLLSLAILDYSNCVFAKFSMSVLYSYDKEGVMNFLDYHAKIIEYDDKKGNSLQEVKENLINDAKDSFKSENAKKYFKMHDIKNKWSFMYSLINEKNIKDSVVAMCNTEEELYCLVRPYYKHSVDKLEFVRDWEFNYDGGLFCLLEENFNIHKFDNRDFAHFPIWSEIQVLMPNIENKKGINKYLNYCKQKGIPKKMLTEFTEEEIKEIMKHCKKEKDRER